jgi:hypothetical protein
MIIELGVFVSVTAVPTVFVPVSMGTSEVPVVLATYTVVAEVPLTAVPNLLL